MKWIFGPLPISRILTPLLSFCLLICLLLSTAGCRDSPSIYRVREGIVRQIPGIRLERETSVRLGRISTALIRKVTKMALDEECDAEELALITSLRRIDVGIYKIHGLPVRREIEIPQSLERYLEKGGWQTVVKRREVGDQTWVFLREEDGSIRNLFVVFLDGDELGLIQIEGEIERAVAALFKESPEGITETLIDSVGRS